MSDVSDASDVSGQLERLRRENEELRARLRAIEERKAAGAEHRKTVLKVGWSVLFPLFDRKKVLRTGMQLFATASAYAGPAEGWPTREALVEDARQFAQAMLRLAIRRRVLMLVLSLVAFLIPGIQIWLVYQQNQIIDKQNKFFEIQVFDTAARGLTTGTATSRQVTSALLAKVDLDLLQGMVEGVFEADVGGAFTASDIDARSRRMEAAAFRGYLIDALSRQIRARADELPVAALDERVTPIFETIVADAGFRLPELLRIGGAAAAEDSALAEEVSNYLLRLVNLMRTHYKLALSTGDEDRYFATIAPLLARTAGRRSSLPGDGSPFEDVFFRGAIPELLLDLGQGTRFGEPDQPLGSDAEINRLTRAGFEKLKAGVGNKAPVHWDTLENLVSLR